MEVFNMNKLSNTAKKLDTFFKVLNVFLMIGIVCCLVGLGIIAVGFLFDLDPYTIGTGYTSISIGSLELELAQEYAPDKSLVLILLAVELVIALICLLVLRPCIICVRDILKPMINGEPFHSTISANLKKLAKHSLILCVLTNLVQIVSNSMYVLNFGLEELLISEKVTHITISTDIDLTFLIVAAVLYLLSYIFHYGEELQQLSDETV